MYLLYLRYMYESTIRLMLYTHPFMISESEMPILWAFHGWVQNNYHWAALTFCPASE